MSKNTTAHQERVKNAVRFLMNAPQATVPEAMRVARFLQPWPNNNNDNNNDHGKNYDCGKTPCCARQGLIRCCGTSWGGRYATRLERQCEGEDIDDEGGDAIKGWQGSAWEEGQSTDSSNGGIRLCWTIEWRPLMSSCPIAPWIWRGTLLAWPRISSWPSSHTPFQLIGAALENPGLTFHMRLQRKQRGVFRHGIVLI